MPFHAMPCRAVPRHAMPCSCAVRHGKSCHGAACRGMASHSTSGHTVGLPWHAMEHRGVLRQD
eukprot:1615800-Lingulodinium_polyedra.AAC.1